MNFSIIIVTFKRARLLENCLQSLKSSLNDYENHIQIVINGDDRETENLLKENYPAINFKKIEALTPGEARNIAFQDLEADWLCFLDDDVILPEDYFAKALTFIEENPETEVFGGPDQNYPNATKFEEAIGLTLTSPLATAHTRYRHKSNDEKVIYHAKENQLILCNLWIKKDVLKGDELQFDSRFFRNEENVLLYQLKNNGKNICFLPHLYVYHKKKGDLKSLARAVQSSGSHRLRSFFLFPSSFSILYFIPFFFVLYLLTLPIHYFFNLPEFYFYPLIAYLILNALSTFLICIRNNSWSYLHLIPIIQTAINIHYGLGFLKEFLRKIKGEKPYS